MTTVTFYEVTWNGLVPFGQVKSLPDGTIQVDPDVQWFVTPDISIDAERRAGSPQLTMRDGDRFVKALPLTFHSSTIYAEEDPETLTTQVQAVRTVIQIDPWHDLKGRFTTLEGAAEHHPNPHVRSLASGILEGTHRNRNHREELSRIWAEETWQKQLRSKAKVGGLQGENAHEAMVKKSWTLHHGRAIDTAMKPGWTETKHFGLPSNRKPGQVIESPETPKELSTLAIKNPAIQNFLEKTRTKMADLGGPEGTPQETEARFRGNLEAAFAMHPAGERAYDGRWYQMTATWADQIAERLGLHRDTVGGMLAAFSPGTRWGKNRALVVTTRLLSHQNPAILVSQQDIDKYNALQKVKAGDHLYPPFTGEPRHYHVADLIPMHVAGVMGTSFGITGKSARANLARALAIMRSNQGAESVDTWLVGPKIRSFYNNIIDPMNPSYVTVDEWMYRAALGTQAWHFDGPKRPAMTLDNWIETGPRDDFDKPKRSATLALGETPTSKLVQTAGLYTPISQLIRSLGDAHGLLPNEFQAIAWVALVRSRGGHGGWT